MHGKNLGPHNLGCRGYDGAGPVWDKQDRERKGPDPYAKIKDPMARQYIRSHYREDPKNPGHLVLNAADKELEKEILIEEQLSQSDSSSVTKAPWDTSFHRAINKRKNKEVALPPHRGRVIGARVGRKRSNYYPESKEERSDRRASSMQANIDIAVTKAVAAILPTIYPNPDRDEQTPPANPNPDRYVHGSAERSSPSISCTPGAVPGPSPLDELNALTVILLTMLYITSFLHDTLSNALLVNGEHADHTRCTLLLFVDGELKEVAKATIETPRIRTHLKRPIPDECYKVSLARVF